MQVVYHVDVRFIGTHPLLVILDKRCNACLQFKDFDAYGNAQLMQDRMKTICKECRKDRNVKSFSAYLMVSPDTRICTKCLKPKRFPDDFNKMQDGEGGYCWYCKQCQSEYNQQQRLDHLDEYHARAHVRNTSPEGRAQKMKRYHERMDTDPDFVESGRQRSMRNYYNHTMEYRERYNRYMARKLEATVEKVDYTHILERDGWFCHICNQPIDPNAKPRSAASLDFDHVVPLNPRPGESQGTHSEANLKPSHKACNIRKSNKPMWALTERNRRGVA